MTYTIMSRIRQSLSATYESFKQGGDLEDNHGYRQTPVKGIPTFISEYGGIKWDEEGVEKDGWGYGAGPATKEEFLNRYKGLTDALLDNPPYVCLLLYPAV